MTWQTAKSRSAALVAALLPKIATVRENTPEARALYVSSHHPKN